MSQEDKITDEQRAAIIALLDEGHSSGDIASQLGLSMQRVAGVKAHWSRGTYVEGIPSTSKPSKGIFKKPKINSLGKAPVGLPDKPVKTGYQLNESEDENTADLIYTSQTIPKSSEELLDWCNVDQKVWKVLDKKVNMWTVTMKANSKGDGKTHMNWQIFAKLIRKEPLAVKFPAIQPVVISSPSFKPNKPAKVKKDEVQTALLFGDAQLGYRKDQDTNDLQPFHDRACLDVISQINAYLKPDVRVYVGDMLDLAPWSSKFKQEAGFYYTTQPAFNEWSWWLQVFESVPAHESYWIEGNHESRMDTAVLKSLHEAFNLHKPSIRASIKAEVEPSAISIPGLLSLRELGIDYLGPYPKGELWLNSNVRVSHGNIVRSASGKSVQAIVKDAGCTEICGHIHRLESAFKTIHRYRGPVTYGAFSVGTTARIDDAVPAAGTNLNWQQGFGIIRFTKSGWYHVNQYSINDGTVLFDGKLFKAGDQTKLIETITKDTGTDYIRR